MGVPTLAIWKFASCDGCQLTLLDCEDELLAIAGRVKIAHFVEASSEVQPGPYDVSLVEGSITTAADAERIRRVREMSRTLVTIGACATAGGVQALRNFADVAEFTSVVYARPEYISVLATSTPIAAHVDVDFELHGCPIDRRQLLEVITALLAGPDGNTQRRRPGGTAAGHLHERGRCPAGIPHVQRRCARLHRAVPGHRRAAAGARAARHRGNSEGERLTHRNDRTLAVSALARVEGEGAMHVRAPRGAVEDVRLEIYEPPRFFEAFLRGRRHTEPPDITARICGICPVAYQMSACLAIEAACGIEVTAPIADLRRLLYCGEWIESHALHIYLLHAPTSSVTPARSTWRKTAAAWSSAGWR